MADAPNPAAPEGPADPPTPDPPEVKPDPVQLPDDHPVVKSLAAVRAELKEAQGKLKQAEDAEKDDLTRATESAASEKERADNAEAELARLRAAVKHGLSEDDLDLLGAGTPDEIEARAKRLSERIGTSDQERRTPAPALGQPGGDPGVDVQSLVDSIPSTA